jgi:hypothetical protein
MQLTTPEIISQRHTWDSRFYEIQQIDGTTVFYPSVTTILDGVRVGGALDEWKAQQAAALGVEGARYDMWLRAQRGSRVHDAINRYNQGRPLFWEDEEGRSIYDDFEWKSICRYVQWFEDASPEVLATEMTVFSREFGYAGTCDAIMRIGEEIFVVDFKTSRQVVDEHTMQVAAYQAAVREMFPQLGISGGAVLALNTAHKVGYHFKPVADFARTFNSFLNRLNVFQDAHPTFEPKRDILPTVIVPKHKVGGLV